MTLADIISELRPLARFLGWHPMQSRHAADVDNALHGWRLDQTFDDDAGQFHIYRHRATQRRAILDAQGAAYRMTDDGIKPMHPSDALADAVGLFPKRTEQPS